MQSQHKPPLGLVSENIRSLVNDRKAKLQDKEFDRLRAIFEGQPPDSLERKMLQGEPVTLEELEAAKLRLEGGLVHTLSKKDAKLVHHWLEGSQQRIRQEHEQTGNW